LLLSDRAGRDLSFTREAIVVRGAEISDQKIADRRIDIT
jgi:hypothetical protein